MKRFILFFLVQFLLFKGFTQPFRSSNLPIIVLNTSSSVIIPDFKYDGSIRIVYNGDGVRNSLSDNNHYLGKMALEIRGQSSQQFPMKSYNLELRNDISEEVDFPLLGMSAESDWVLYAPYTDKTLMRNFLAYTLSNEMGHWAPHSKFVEVVLNGEYVGIYLLVEKIKRSQGRLNLSKLETDDISGDDVTGGYIFSIDKSPNGWFSTYTVPNSSDGAKRQYSFVYPKYEAIAPQQKLYIQSAVDKFENAAASNYFQDPEIGVGNYIDYSSFVDFHIMQELSRNVDGYRISAYFHKNNDSKNPKIIAGPVWDFDIAFRNADYCDGSSTSGWALNHNYVCVSPASSGIPFFWYKLAREDSNFNNILHCHWNSFRNNILSFNYLDHLIDSIATLTEEARGRHFSKWPILGTYVWPNPQPIPTDYPGEIAALKQWIRDRINWLDDNFPQTGRCWPANLEGTLIAKVYPNPLSISNTLKIYAKKNQAVYLQFFDGTGKLLYQNRRNLIEGENVFTNEVNTAKWSKGIYYLRCVGANGETSTQKLIK
jgi:hypothetical protein